MNKKEFEKVFAAAAEESGVAKMARNYQFAKNLQGMMIELRDKLCTFEQPSEDLEDEFNTYCVHGDIRNPNFDGPFGYDDLRKTAIHFVNWQKEQDKALIERAEDHAKLAGMALGEKEAINKAYKWLENNVENYVWCGEGDLGICGDFLPDFERAMEEK